MQGIIGFVVYCYMAIAFYFTVVFEFAIFAKQGFLAWLLLGSWLAPILGLLWPFTTNVFSG